MPIKRTFHAQTPPPPPYCNYPTLGRLFAKFFIFFIFLTSLVNNIRAYEAIFRLCRVLFCFMGIWSLCYKKPLIRKI